MDKAGKKVICQVCNKESYRSPKYSLISKYCSYSCSNKGRKKGKNIKCEICKKTYYKALSTLAWHNSKYCSNPCRFKGQSIKTMGKPKIKDGKIWTYRNADKLFSDYIRQRDGWNCRRCSKNFEHRTGQLHNSHFWGRGRMITRFDPENCIALCFHCHKFKMENEKQGEYKGLMVKWLGQDRYDALEKRANQEIIKREEAIKRFMVWYIPVMKDRDIPKKKHWPPSPFDEDLIPEDLM